MKDLDLVNLAVAYLAKEHEKIIQKNHKVDFSAKYIADKVGGYAGSIGRVSEKVVTNLRAMGIFCEYDKNSNPKKFIIYSKVCN